MRYTCEGGGGGLTSVPEDLLTLQSGGRWSWSTGSSGSTAAVARRGSVP